MKKKQSRNGNPSDIASLTFHNWFGEIMDRIKCKTTEKDKGIIMLNKIEGYFNIGPLDRQVFREKLREREIKDFEEMEKQADERRKVEWTRDEKGKIVSPFKDIEKNKG